MRKELRIRVEGPDEVGKHTFVVEPMNMDMQLSPDTPMSLVNPAMVSQVHLFLSHGGLYLTLLGESLTSPQEG